MSSMVERVRDAIWKADDYGVMKVEAERMARTAIDEIFPDDLLSRLDKRVEGITEWLGDEAPYVMADQKHLTENTPERAYWHYGYMIAIQDVLRAIRKEPMPGQEDK